MHFITFIDVCVSVSVCGCPLRQESDVSCLQLWLQETPSCYMGAGSWTQPFAWEANTLNLWATSYSLYVSCFFTVRNQRQNFIKTMNYKASGKKSNSRYSTQSSHSDLIRTSRSTQSAALKPWHLRLLSLNTSPTIHTVSFHPSQVKQHLMLKHQTPSHS